jgi:hypothetical protein
MTGLWPATDSAQQCSEQAQALIDAAADTSIELVALSGLDLCALDGPQLMLFDWPLVDAWAQPTDPAAGCVVGASALGRAALAGQRTGSGPPRPGRTVVHPWDPARQEIYRDKVAKSFRLKPTNLATNRDTGSDATHPHNYGR